jgi:hypothetical protein
MAKTFDSIKNAIKRTPIIKKIDLNDGEEPVKLCINPSEEEREKIVNIVLKDIGNNKNENNEELIINLGKKEIFIPIVSLITDIKLKKQDEILFMEYLFKDPSPEGIMLRDDIIKVIYNVLDKFMDNLKIDEDEDDKINKD